MNKNKSELNKEDNKFLKAVGKNIQNTRLKRGITLEEMSEKTNIRINYLKKIEKGEARGVTTSKVILISDALNIKLYELLKGC